MVRRSIVDERTTQKAVVQQQDEPKTNDKTGQAVWHSKCH